MRVSTRSQDTASQKPELRRWAESHEGDSCWYRDTYTGTSMDRPGFRQLMNYPGEDDPPTRTAFPPGQSGLGYGFLTDGTGIHDHGIHGSHGRTRGSGLHSLSSFPCDPCVTWSES